MKPVNFRNELHSTNLTYLGYGGNVMVHNLTGYNPLVDDHCEPDDLIHVWQVDDGAGVEMAGCYFYAYDRKLADDEIPDTLLIDGETYDRQISTVCMIESDFKNYSTQNTESLIDAVSHMEIFIACAMDTVTVSGRTKHMIELLDAYRDQAMALTACIQQFADITDKLQTEMQHAPAGRMPELWKGQGDINHLIDCENYPLSESVDDMYICTDAWNNNVNGAVAQYIALLQGEG